MQIEFSFDELKPGFSNKTGTTSQRKQSGSNQDYEETFIGPAATFERKGHTGLGRSLLPVRCFDSFSVTTETDVVLIEPLQVMSDDKDIETWLVTWSHRVRSRIFQNWHWATMGVVRWALHMHSWSAHQGTVELTLRMNIGAHPYIYIYTYTYICFSLFTSIAPSVCIWMQTGF